MNHRTLIKEHLKSGKRITPQQALRMFGCARLAARILELKEEGMNIQKQMIQVDTAHGHKARVAEYRLA